MTRNWGRVLIVDDDPDILMAARLVLEDHVEIVQTESDPLKMMARLAERPFDCIILDMNFTRNRTDGQEGFSALERLLRLDPDQVVVLMTAFGDTNVAVKAIKRGAFDFVLKPWHNEKLIATVHAALGHRRSRLELQRFKSRQRQLVTDLNPPSPVIIGSGQEMARVFETIRKVGKTDANILILGENGTGKELVARALHRASLRRNEVFVGLDVGSIAESLFESELFGHEKGAFTDANQRRLGRFETATGGTLFMDEIGNLPLAMQAKILRVLETRCVTRVGSNRAVPVDIRLICATNLDIHRMVHEQQFRQDLLYRINTVEIRLPPLRERRSDIEELAHHFLVIYKRKYQKNVNAISHHAINKLKRYRWPGNVRELSHAVERAVILCDNRKLNSDDFMLHSAAQGGTELVLESLNLRDIERKVILMAMSQCAGNMSHVARKLGLTRASLYRRIAKHGLN